MCGQFLPPERFLRCDPSLERHPCLGHCAKGVNVKTDGISENMMKKASISTEDGFLLLHNVTKDNAEELFVKEIYPLIEI